MGFKRRAGSLLEAAEEKEAERGALLPGSREVKCCFKPVCFVRTGKQRSCPVLVREFLCVS